MSLYIEYYHGKNIIRTNNELLITRGDAENDGSKTKNLLLD